MIYSARFKMFYFSRFEKWGRTEDNMCENNDPYRPWITDCKVLFSKYIVWKK